MNGSRHRGQHPQDHKLFAPNQHKRLQAAVAELSWLYSQGYAPTAALKLVGDRHSLTERQRKAVLRGACSDEARASRQARRVDFAQIGDKTMLIDGFNCLITFEAALSHGFVFIGRDGVCRDLSSVHGTYRQVAETMFAAEIIGRILAQAKVKSSVWYLDRPVSNSGRLKTVLLDIAARREWDWQVELSINPDVLLMEKAQDPTVVVATSDAWILDHCGAWIDLLGSSLQSSGHALSADIAPGPRLAMRPDLWLIDLRIADEVL